MLPPFPLRSLREVNTFRAEFAKFGKALFDYEHEHEHEHE